MSQEDSDRIADLFEQDVTRDIPPVVYFSEQKPEKVADEVSEYIITGGWNENHPNARKYPDGIHEQYVKLLRAISTELDKPGGPELPNAWISGFYGSGKSSFAKLLGLALDGLELPDGRSLAEVWLSRDKSDRAHELREAWTALRTKVDPIGVVFDIGGVAEDGQHIHAAAIEQVQLRLGYCSTQPLVADFELKLERDGMYAKFEQVAQDQLGKPWSQVKDQHMAEEDFSLVMWAMFPEKYTDPMSWFTSRGGTHRRSESPEDAVAALRDMIKFRKPGATLFLVIDEVSQYVLSSKDRVDRLRAFASALGSGLKGKAWLLALGQQKVDEEADDSFLVWAKDRFPKSLQVHLAPTNIRDVVHKRLLLKTADATKRLEGLFEENRPSLKLYAYGCENVTPDEFAEVYPMLPGYIDLLLQITSALRTRSSRAQGDDQAIRGLLQLLGELFRSQKLAQMPVGSLVTLDQIYEVQQTALDSDAQSTMARILSQCADEADAMLVKAAKAVALLELVQETMPTDARLVAQCLYDRVDRGNRVSEVTEALEELKRRGLLAHSEKTGYKLQSSAAEEWDRERHDIPVSREKIAEVVQDGLKYLLAEPARPRYKTRSFPWAGVFSDGRRVENASIADPRDDAVVRVDFRYLTADERAQSTWVKRSDEPSMRNLLVWVAGDSQQLDEDARGLARSAAMVAKYRPRRESLPGARKLLLQQEENRVEDRKAAARQSVAQAWMSGKLYFRGRTIDPQEHGASFAAVLSSVADRILPELFPHFTAVQVQPSELAQLLQKELSGPSPKFLGEELGILELDSNRYMPVCSGTVPVGVLEYIDSEGGISGTGLLAHFGGPPYGYTTGVVQACVAGLLRASKVRIRPEGGAEITAIRDAGAQDLFGKDRAFRRADFFVAGEDEVGPRARAKICKFFQEHLGYVMDREDHAIADAVSQLFPIQAKLLREVEGRIRRLPGGGSIPDALVRLEGALEKCVSTCRQTQPTVALVKKNFDVLQDGIKKLREYNAELTEEAIAKLRKAAEVRDHQGQQLADEGLLTTELEAALERVKAQLSGERPWRDIASIDADLEALRTAYTVERAERLRWQEQQVEQARAAVKGREGFATLSSEKSHQVLRPFSNATTSTSEEAVAPSLSALKAPFVVELGRAQEAANERLDEFLSEGDKPLIMKVSLDLRGRELSTEEDVLALLDEIEKKLRAHIPGARVRVL